MNLLHSPRNKLIAATAALLALLLLGPAKGADAPTIARLLLGVACVTGLGWWFLRQKQAAFALDPAPSLRVLARAGLSQRCGMALVDADGESYLVVYGDGFAEVHEAPRPPAKVKAPRRVQAQGRRPRPTATTRRRPARKGGAR